MLQLHLDIQGKAARVGFASLPFARRRSVWSQRTSAGPVTRVRLLNGLNASVSPAGLKAEDLIAGDPEIDWTRGGRRLDAELTTAYYDPADPQAVPVGDFKEIDIVTDAQGNEKERRPHAMKATNLNGVHPIRIARRLPVRQALTSFVFRHCYQLAHEDALVMDFLLGLARDLHERQEMALLGAGPKGNQPLIVREGGTAYRAFLHGEVRGDEYKLAVMLSDQELKRPEASAPAAPAAAP